MNSETWAWTVSRVRFNWKNLTRQNGLDFLRLIPEIGIVTKTTRSRLTKLVVRWMSVEGQIVMTRPAGAFAEGWSSAGSPKGAIDATGGASVGVGAEYEW